MTNAAAVGDEPRQLGIKVRPSISQRLDVVASFEGKTKSEVAEEAFTRFLVEAERAIYSRAARRKSRA